MMKLSAAAAVLLAVLGMGTAHADDYPNRPIRMLLPFSAGGGGDTLGRILAERFAVELKQPVIVENKPGAGGTIGIAAVARAAPDGYTITIGGMTTHILSPSVYKDLQYDPIKSFTSLGAIGNSAIMVVANNNFAANNIAELKNLAASRKYPVQYGSWGIGSTGHFCGEVLVQKGGLKLQHVPYKGTTQIMTDIMGGHVDVGFVDMATATPMVTQHKVKGLAVCTQRSPSVPDIQLQGTGYRLRSRVELGHVRSGRNASAYRCQAVRHAGKGAQGSGRQGQAAWTGHYGKLRSRTGARKGQHR